MRLSFIDLKKNKALHEQPQLRAATTQSQLLQKTPILYQDTNSVTLC